MSVASHRIPLRFFLYYFISFCLFACVCMFFFASIFFVSVVFTWPPLRANIQQFVSEMTSKAKTLSFNRFNGNCTHIHTLTVWKLSPSFDKNKTFLFDAYPHLVCTRYLGQRSTVELSKTRHFTNMQFFESKKKIWSMQ